MGLLPFAEREWEKVPGRTDEGWRSCRKAKHATLKC